jgi:RNA polymerase sigma factor (sigma-70 family)
MAHGSARPNVLNPFDALFRFGVVGDLSDEQLLHRFLTAPDGADQAAFTALVERHGPMVLRVCREVLGNAHDAQDAFQATFLVLARKAASIRKADSLAGWLHGVAHRIALRARSDAVRRRIHEQQVGAMKVVAMEREESRAESWAELHEEVARLPERYREPVVLCYLEGLSTEEAALRIGCPSGTIFSRLSRARERLRGRLIRRGVALPAALLTVGWRTPVRASLSASWLKATVRASQGFAGRRAAEAGSASVAALARGVLDAMVVSKLKLLGAAGLVCTLALGSVQTLGRIGRLDGAREPVGSAPDAHDSQAALTRSVDRLESELEETSRRNAEMLRELREIRGRLNAVREAPERAALAAAKAVAQVADALAPDPSRAVARLADALKRHPARRFPKEGNRLRLYMMDLVDGGTTLLADESEPGFNWCNTPKWSHDGTRIVFATWPLPGFERSRIKAIEIRDGLPTCIDLGPGNSPTFSPNDRRIAFALEAESVPDAEAGVWVMQADGSERRRVGEYLGAPFWSPDGRELLTCDYSARSIVINLETKEAAVLAVPGHRIWSWPSWAGPGTLVSSLATGQEGDSIALLDVRKPAEAKIIEVLWKRSDEFDVTPLWPVYRADTRRCFFVGLEPTKRTLLSVQRGEPGRVKRLEPRGYDDKLGGLWFSPDGRYLLFCGDRPGPK